MHLPMSLIGLYMYQDYVREYGSPTASSEHLLTKSNVHY